MRKNLMVLLLVLIILWVIPNNLIYASEIEVPYFGTKYELLQEHVKVMAVDDYYVWAAAGDQDAGYMRSLFRSDDYGNYWEQVYLFDQAIEAIHIMHDGTILVSISNGRWLEDADSKIMRSVDGGKSFEPVLRLESGAAYMWNIASDDDGYVFVSEYGYKDLPNNSRRIYRSKNYGDSWEIVYEPEEMDGIHNHIINIDNNDSNIIYQVVGDNEKHILRSIDRGRTWESILSGYHPTSVIQIEDNIFWGLDNSPKSGIIKYNTMTEEWGYAFETPKPYSGSIYHMLYVNDVIYAGLLSYSDPSNYWDGSIFISRDQGNTWEIFATWPKYEDKGIGLYKFESLDDYGFIYGSFPVIRDDKVVNFQGTLRFELLNVPPKVIYGPELLEAYMPEGYGE